MDSVAVSTFSRPLRPIFRDYVSYEIIAANIVSAGASVRRPPRFTSEPAHYVSVTLPVFSPMMDADMCYLAGVVFEAASCTMVA